MKELTRDLWLQLLDKVAIPYNEGESSISNIGATNRIVFWDYLWEDISASNEEYANLVTYQVSFFSNEPPRMNEKLIELRNELRNYGIRPVISHEYVIEKKNFHSYFKLEILENGL